MNLPMYMLLNKQKEYMDYYNKYNNRYRLLQESPYMVYMEDNGEKHIKYFREMRDLYRKKYGEICEIIRSRV